MRISYDTERWSDCVYIGMAGGGDWAIWSDCVDAVMVGGGVSTDDDAPGGD